MIKILIFYKNFDSIDEGVQTVNHVLPPTHADTRWYHREIVLLNMHAMVSLTTEAFHIGAIIHDGNSHLPSGNPDAKMSFFMCDELCY